MSESLILNRRRTLKPVLLATILFLAIGLTAGAGVIWWQNREIKPVMLNASEKDTVAQKVDPETYQPGEKTIILTERELNGLLHLHTQLGGKVSFKLAKDAIHARVKTELDEDLPVLGGKTLKAKARFLVNTHENTPKIILDDLTLYGISLPNAWLGDLKGKNLLATVSGTEGSNTFGRGVENISIHPGELRIELAE